MKWRVAKNQSKQNCSQFFLKIYQSPTILLVFQLFHLSDSTFTLHTLQIHKMRKSVKKFYLKKVGTRRAIKYGKSESQAGSDFLLHNVAM